MAEQPGNQNQLPVADGSQSVLDSLLGRNTYDQQLANAITQLVRVISKNPRAFEPNRRTINESQSNFTQNAEKWKFEDRHSRPKHRNSGNILEDFETGIKEQLLDSLAGGSLKKGIQGALDTFAKEFGMDLRDLPNEAGRALTKQALSAFNNSKTGQNLKAQAAKLGNQALDAVFDKVEHGDAAKTAIKNTIQSFRNGGTSGVDGTSSILSDATSIAEEASKAAEATADAATTAATESVAATGEATAAAEGVAAAGESMAGVAVSADAAMAGLAEVGTLLFPEGLIILAAVLVAVEALGPAFEGLADVAEASGKAFMKSEEKRQKRAEQGQQRLEDTVNDMVKKPFEILEKATEEWYNTWDANLRKVGQTQGYDKEAVYKLYEGYAERLREDNLSSVISATDIVEKLSAVLDSGLSGEAAEEFAYIATKLNAAIPTQDFFGYVDTYASIASNALAQGQSQTEALAKANAELEQFASNLLYSSRELAGGFSTGLKNSATLFQNAAQIAQTAKTYNASEISGTLTSVSAIIGSVAPDLADALVNNVVQAAIGGNNNTQLVALRSLAGINAGNTEFLRAMAENPQEVFSDLFTTLANMQNMSPDNYMEVAEGLADVFGIDMAAFARVDFNYLAQAIATMNTNSGTLNDNLKLLASGQTTTSAEQLKAQEINRVILDEGLAYVIDSEAGRMVQQHMWEEQLANEMQAATYAVNLQGSALSFLEGIRETITNIMNFLNPIGFIANGVSQLTASIAEAVGNQDDIAEILELGAVGSNTKQFYNLTTVGKDLNLVTSLVEMMGGKKGNALADAASLAFSVSHGGLMGISSAESYNMIADAVYEGVMTGSGTFATPFGDVTGSNAYGAGLLDLVTSNPATSKISRYDWGSVGKSIATGIQGSPMNTTSLIGKVAAMASSASQSIQDATNKKFQEFLDSAEEASKSMSYDKWLETIKNYGISSFEDALAEYGRTEEEIKGYFQANQAKEGAMQETARKEDEQLFRDENREFWDYANGSSGVFQTAMWLPFFGDGMKYDTRMDAVDTAMSEIQLQIGNASKYTVIGGLTEISEKLGDDTNYTVIGVLTQIRTDMSTTFVSTSSLFQRCLRDWIRYIDESKQYSATVSRAQAWSDLQSAEKDQQTQATLALANALGVFSAEELKKLDPQLQTNVLLGEIVTILQTIMQQNNTAGGGFSLIDSLSAMGFGMTKQV